MAKTFGGTGNQVGAGLRSKRAAGDRRRTVRYVSGEEIHRVLTFPTVVQAMEAAHRRPRMESGDLSLGDEKGHYLSLIHI